MMATALSKFLTWFNIFIFFIVLVSLLSTVTSNNSSHPCVDGTYEHDGRTCCLCAAGLYLLQHCTTNLQHGKCDKCGPNTYSSQPNNLLTCEPCTSCTQTNANLEVDESCTAAKDAKCRCQKDHYCSSGIEPCAICQPCKKCGAEGIKVACTAKNNTVCNDPNAGGENTGMIVGIVIVVVVIIGIGLFAYCWRKKKQGNSYEPNEDANHDVLKPLNVENVDLQPFLNSVAEAIGWDDMCMVVRRSKLSDTVISNCERNHPRNTEQQTIELLKEWVERTGKQAPNRLIDILQTSGKQRKAENVRHILSRPVTP